MANDIEIFRKGLTAPEMQGQMTAVLPKGVTIEKMTEVAVMAVSQDPQLLEADRNSLYRACLAAAKRGLLPDKQEAALVVHSINTGTREKPVYSKQVVLLPMVQGIIREMFAAGALASAVCVYENDKVDVWNDDTGQHFTHRASVFRPEGQGKIAGVIAWATYQGRTFVEAMNLEDIEQVRSRSKQQDNEGNPTGPWKSDFDRMAQKSALHRLRRRLGLAPPEKDVDDLDAVGKTDSNDALQQEQAPPKTAVDVDTGEIVTIPTGVAPPTPTVEPRKRPRGLQAVLEQGEIP